MTDMITRRNFLRKSGMIGAGLSLAPLSGLAKAAASDRVVVAVIGVRSRGEVLTRKFSSLANCHVKYIVDVDERYLAPACETAMKHQGSKPTTERDFRKVLADPDVDAVVIATPDHWHAPMAIRAAQAGKHVYVEKPCGHNPREGELLVEVQKKTGKLIQMGNQRRSMKNFQLMAKDIQGGVIGNAYMVKTWYVNTRETIGFGKVAAVPEYLDWDLWQGPAPRCDYRDNVHPYNWHWFWHWGTGEALNNGTHEIDVARWVLGVEFPTKVASLGGRYHYVGQDDWECPDTQAINIEFEEGKLITWEGRSCNGYDTTGLGRSGIIFGSKGTVTYTDESYTAYDLKKKEIKTVGGNITKADGTNTVDPGLQDYHAKNFIDSVLGKDTLNSPIDKGHKSVLLCQLGNIALRTGSTLHCDPKNGHVLNNDGAMKLWSREYEAGWEPRV